MTPEQQETKRQQIAFLALKVKEIQEGLPHTKVSIFCRIPEIEDGVLIIGDDPLTEIIPRLVKLNERFMAGDPKVNVTAAHFHKGE